MGVSLEKTLTCLVPMGPAFVMMLGGLEGEINASGTLSPLRFDIVVRLPFGAGLAGPDLVFTQSLR